MCLLSGKTGRARAGANSDQKLRVLQLFPFSRNPLGPFPPSCPGSTDGSGAGANLLGEMGDEVTVGPGRWRGLKGNVVLQLIRGLGSRLFPTGDAIEEAVDGVIESGIILSDSNSCHLSQL